MKACIVFLALLLSLALFALDWKAEALEVLFIGISQLPLKKGGN